MDTIEKFNLEKTLNFLYERIKNIRFQALTPEKLKEAYVYFVSFFKFLNIDFPTEVLRIDLKFNEHKEIFCKVIDELAIIGYHYKMGNYIHMALDQVTLDKNVIIDIGQIMNNRKFYLKKLSLKSSIEIKPILKEGFTSMNSSIIKIRDGYLGCIRTVNYRLFKDGAFEILDPQKKQKSINYLLNFDNNFNILDQREITDVSNYQKFSSVRNIEGLEDIVIFYNAVGVNYSW